MNQKIACMCIVGKDMSYLENAIQCFQNQTYAQKELWVLFNGNEQQVSALPKHFEHVNHIVLKEIANGHTPVWLQEVKQKTDSWLFFVEINPIQYANRGKKRNLVLALTDAEFVCTWSPLAHHANDRLSRQMSFSKLLNKSACALSSTLVYNQSDRSAGTSHPLENGIMETLLLRKNGLVFPDLDVNEEDELQHYLMQHQDICLLDEPELYTRIASFGEGYPLLNRYSEEDSETFRIRIGAKKEYDGVLSLGTWCQVGAAIRRWGLTDINSPIHNFGIKSWKNLLTILENRFDGYWERENMVIGKTDVGYSAQYNDERPVFKVYCNKYNMISNHHFDEVDNSPTELKTFESFKEKIDVLSEIFLLQCQQYDRVLFGLRIMSAPEETVIEKEDLLRLVNVLNALREGKPYELRMSVPEAQFEHVKRWVEEEALSQVAVYPWSILWNNDPQDAEWKWMFGDAKIADDYFERLNKQIIGFEEISHPHIHYLNS